MGNNDPLLALTEFYNHI